MDPVTAISAGLNAIPNMYEKIKQAKAEGKIKKAEALEVEIKAHAESDSKMLNIVETGNCAGISDVKAFKKMMKEVFKRHPDQQALLGKKFDKCIEIAKGKSKH